MRSGLNPWSRYSKPRPSSPIRSAAGTGSASINSWFEFDRFAAHFRDLARTFDVAAIQARYKTKLKPVGRLAAGAGWRGAGEQQHLSATCAVEIQILAPVIV
jgi:hypothetical protein